MLQRIKQSLVMTDFKPRYVIKPKNKYFGVTSLLVETEIRPQNTATLLSEVRLDRIEKLRASHASVPKPSYTALVARAVAIALHEHPVANRRVMSGWLWRILGRRVQEFKNVDISVAVERNIVDAEGFSFVEVLRNVDHRSLADISKSLAMLVSSDAESSRNWNTIRKLIRIFPVRLVWLVGQMACWIPSIWVEHRGGAVLISSPGKYGAHAILASWPWPIGISFGHVRLRPVVEEGQVIAAPTFFLTMNFDRRLLAGAPAARLFQRIVQLLETADSQIV